MNEYREKEHKVVGPDEAFLKPSSTGCPVRIFVHSGKLTCGTFVIPPHGRLGRISAHGGDEVYYVVQGTCRVSLPRLEQTVEVKQGHTLYIPAGMIHQTSNDGREEAEVFWCAAPEWP